MLLTLALMLSTDDEKIDVEIKKLYTERSKLVSELRDLEYGDPLRGHDLKPLGRDEIAAIRANLPGF